MSEQAAKRVKLSVDVNTLYKWPELTTLANLEMKSVFERGPSSLKICSEGGILGQVIPLNQIFLRDCYEPLFDRIWESLASSRGVAVSGTPGIGKSLFGVLCFIEILRRTLNKEQKSLRYGKSLTADGQLIYQRTDESGACFHYIIEPANSMEVRGVPGPYVGRAATFMVLDGPGPFPDDVTCPVLWLTSPSPSVATGIAKNYLLQLFMPLWTAEELVECWKLGCASDSVLHWKLVPNEMEEQTDDEDEKKEEEVSDEGLLRRWIAAYGPIPRRVFGPCNSRDFVAKAKSAIKSKPMTGNDILAIVKGKLEPNPKMQPLMNMAVHNSLVRVRYVPATLKIGRTILEVFKDEREKGAWWSFVREILGRMEARWSLEEVKFSKNWFLPCVEQVLCQNANRRLRNLKTGERIEVRFPERYFQRCLNEDIDQRTSRIYAPRFPELLAVDFWSSDMLFRCALTLEAPIDVEHPHLLKLREVLCPPPRDSSSFKFVFVVPKRFEHKFELQPCLGKGGWSDLEQFVIVVDEFC